jgi:hypothetical protein
VEDAAVIEGDLVLTNGSGKTGCHQRLGGSGQCAWGDACRAYAMGARGVLGAVTVHILVERACRVTVVHKGVS